MNETQITRLHEINRKILNCRECLFHKALTDKGILYKPDAPCEDPEKLKQSNFRVLSVGLNPKWEESDNKDRKAFFEEIYKMDVTTEEEYLAYVSKLLSTPAKGRRDPYMHHLAKIFNLMNRELKIYNDGIQIPAKYIYQYVFWSNLSFCSSNDIASPHREFFGEKDIPNNFQEEAERCISCGYLRDIIDCLNPKMILFLGMHSDDPAELVRKILGVPHEDVVHKGSEPFEAYRTRYDKPVKSTISVYFSISRDIIMLFHPHPRFPWNDTCREKAISWVCSKVKEIKA